MSHFVRDLQRALLSQPTAQRCPRCAIVLLAPPTTCPHCHHALTSESNHAAR